MVTGTKTKIIQTRSFNYFSFIARMTHIEFHCLFLIVIRILIYKEQRQCKVEVPLQWRLLLLSIKHKTNNKQVDVINAFATSVSQQYKYSYEGMQINCQLIDIIQNLYSLSRREESYKHTLSDCLLVCPHLTDSSKNEVKIFYKGWPKGNQGRGTRIWC